MPKSRNVDAELRDIVTQHVDRLVDDLTAAVRRAIAQEVREYLSGNTVKGRARFVDMATSKPRKKRSMACIAPGCSARSKGPRFHYLCEKHKDTPKRQYEKWRASSRG